MKHFRARRGAFQRELKSLGDLITFDFLDMRKAADAGLGIDDGAEKSWSSRTMSLHAVMSDSSVHLQLCLDIKDFQVCWRMESTGLSRSDWSTNTNPDPTALLECGRSGRVLFCEAPAVEPPCALSARRKLPPSMC